MDLRLHNSLQDRPMENLNLAFDVAEKHLDIPRMLDAEGLWRTLFYTYSHTCALINTCALIHIHVNSFLHKYSHTCILFHSLVLIHTHAHSFYTHSHTNTRLNLHSFTRLYAHTLAYIHYPSSIPLPHFITPTNPITPTPPPALQIW